VGTCRSACRNISSTVFYDDKNLREIYTTFEIQVTSTDLD